MQEWLTQPAAELGRAIGKGDIDPEALTEAFLNAIDAHPLKDRIYARLTPGRARAEAAAASRRAAEKRRLSPLDGVPVSWKDLFDTAGTATEAGSALLKGRVPDDDAKVLRSATAMGLVFLGKTHMSELAFSGLGYNPVTASPPCVNDPEGISGGSSSGAATSVAFGLAPLAIGSDTGGSVRIPAAWNDLVGLKTTSGRVSLKGVVPLCMKFDTVGPLTRTVEDAALALAALEGTAAPDLAGSTLRGRRFAVLNTIALDDVRDAPRAAFHSAVDRLNAAGAEIVAIDVPEVAAAMDLTAALYPTEAYGHWKEVIEAQPSLMYEEILQRFRGGTLTSGPEYAAAWEKLDNLRTAYSAATAGFDAVLGPTSPILPPKMDRLRDDHDYYVTENLLALRNTRIGNLMGITALTLPTGVPSCGISLMTPPGTEERLLRLGAAAEAALA